jgi:DNA transposition AAA+ family ATPase
MSISTTEAEAVDKSTQAEASSAHARLNIPLNLDNWKGLEEPLKTELLWFHQHALDARLSLKECAEALGYDTTTVFRVLKGTYEGNWSNVVGAVRSYRKLEETRGTIQRNEFVENEISRMIFAGLDYALANNSITLIIGESRMGKTFIAGEWRNRNNHGRSVLVTAPAYGGTKALLRDVAQSIGVSQNLSVVDMHKAILRGFNKNRMLIVDEAHRLLPGDRRSNPVNLEILRDIHDRTGCGLALLATHRFDDELKKSTYMFEQLLGRVGMPIRLPREIKDADIEPIVRQYVSRPSQGLMAACHEVANRLGRLGILVETLKVASRIAAKRQAKLGEEHVFKALALRKKMQGDFYAEK